ncbi:MAG TPA: hypothetical protein VJH90_01090 [archaeon]|nr:hypothetical protein [archaeon]
MAASETEFERGRYHVRELTADKAAEIQGLVDRLAKETNEKAKGYRIKNTNLLFHNDTGYIDDYAISRNPPYAWVWINLDFEKKFPECLDEDHKKYRWKEEVEEAVRDHFNNGNRLGGLIGDGHELDHATIYFYGDPRTDLYALTPEKEQVMRTGFSGVRGFAAWFCHIVEKFDAIYRKTMDDYYDSIFTDEGIPEGTFPIADPEITRPKISSPS